MHILVTNAFTFFAELVTFGMELALEVCRLQEASNMHVSGNAIN
jgi:hypothetical protein